MNGNKSRKKKDFLTHSVNSLLTLIHSPSLLALWNPTTNETLNGALLLCNFTSSTAFFFPRLHLSLTPHTTPIAIREMKENCRLKSTTPVNHFSISVFFFFSIRIVSILCFILFEINFMPLWVRSFFSSRTKIEHCVVKSAHLDKVLSFEKTLES